MSWSSLLTQCLLNDAVQPQVRTLEKDDRILSAKSALNFDLSSEKELARNCPISVPEEPVHSFLPSMFPPALLCLIGSP